MRDVPTEFRIMMYADADLTSACVVTVAIMFVSHLLGLGWNPFAVYGITLLAMSLITLPILVFLRKRGVFV